MICPTCHGSGSVPEPATPPSVVLGDGVFVRRIEDWPIDVLARFGWCCVATLSSGRRSLNRDAVWWDEAVAAGVTLTAMDWLPDPHRWATGLEASIAWSAEHGSVCWVVDAELEWRGEDLRAAHYVATARAACTAHRCGLGLTSYARPPQGWPAGVWVPGCPDLAIPQPYDRHGAYEPGYAGVVLDRYRALGAKRLAVGRGAFVDPDGAGPDKARWRTPEEIARHRATTPPIGGDVVGTAWWPPAGQPSAAVVAAITG